MKRKRARHEDASNNEKLISTALRHPFEGLLQQAQHAPSYGGILTPAVSEPSTPKGKRVTNLSRGSSPDTTDTYSSESTGQPQRTRRLYRELQHVISPGPAYPRSAYHGWTPASPVIPESETLERLLNAHKQCFQGYVPPDFTYFELNGFCIYEPLSSAYHRQELVTLDRLSQDGSPEFRFDGYLSVGAERYFVQNVPFRVLTIDGYGDIQSTDMSRQLCIQSHNASRQHVWFRLGRPAKEYRRFYRPFLWLSRFTKHYVDYLLDHCNSQVTLAHFRKKFYAWLCKRYQDEKFSSWLKVANLKDFRTTVAAHVYFLYKECYSIDDKQTGLLDHPIWREVGPTLRAIPKQGNVEQHTVVTPYVFNCFQNMYFGEKLVARQVCNPSIEARVNQRKKALALTPFRRKSSAHLCTSTTLQPVNYSEIKAGDVVVVRPDSTRRTWTNTSDLWYARVFRVRRAIERNLLDVLWLYEPKDTTIGEAYYPFPNELFLSDNCSCGKDALDVQCVVAQVKVAWHVSDPYKQSGFFVRQRFRTVHEQDTYDFATLAPQDFECQCEKKPNIMEECRRKYNIGDTVLVREWSKALDEDRLQPAQILDFLYAENRISLRCLQRKSEANPGSIARPNELQATSEVFKRPPAKIIRNCHVRYFSSNKISAGNITIPYNRDGAGDFFYIADPATLSPASALMDEAEQQGRISTPTPFPPVTQGWDSTAAAQRRKLCGLSLFCGGGTFDRGLEEGGAVDFKYAVDWAPAALHSYRANLPDPDKVHLFLGSVNDYLARAMAGELHIVASPGDVDFMSGGSPCPGFSLLQVYKLSHESKLNASMVASVVSFMDFYSPKYFILENVVTMANPLGPNKDENVFSQIIAAMVGMGYQVQQFLMDAWSFGDPQQRSRLFIIASAPGLSLLEAPPQTHAHPTGFQAQRSIGRSSNDKPFGFRRDDYTAFQHVSAQAATQDLPDIGDSQPQICPRFPDHRLAKSLSHAHRARMAIVPTRPHGMSLMQAALAQRPGLPKIVCGEPLEYCRRGDRNRLRRSPGSNAYARVYPDRLFPTIVTTLGCQDSINGRVVHWDQHRVLTVMEARRAQGYPDYEVLVGTAREQLKVVGNSVARNVALALGLALRRSWMDVEQGVGNGDRNGIDLEGFPQIGDADSFTDDDDDDDAGNADTDNDRDRLEHANDLAIDNRTAKIALHLTSEEIEAVTRDHFKAVRRILDTCHE